MLEYNYYIICGDNYMKKYLSLILIFIIIFSISVPVSANIDKVAASTYYLVAPDTGSVLAEKNCSGNLNPGDFSKIMTAIIAIEKLEKGNSIPFVADALVFKNNFGNIMNVKEGYSLTVYEHLQNMLLLFSDASANQLAISISGSKENFVAEMNNKALELDMKNTQFTSPTGFDGESGKTTVFDLVKLAKYAMELPLFSEICATDVFYLNLNGQEKKFSSRNHLVSKYTYSDYTYKAAMGIMPSYFKDNANFIAFAEKNSSKLIAVIVNSPSDSNLTVYKDVINLLNYGYNNFHYSIICREGEIIDQLPVVGGNVDAATLQCDTSVRAPLPNGYDEELLEVNVRKTSEKVKAPIKKGTILGYADYSYGQNHIATIPLVADKDIKFNIFSFIGDTLFSSINSTFLFILILVIFIWCMLSAKSKAQKAKRAKKRKAIIEKIDRERK